MNGGRYRLLTRPVFHSPKPDSNEVRHSLQPGSSFQPREEGHALAGIHGRSTGQRVATAACDWLSLPRQRRLLASAAYIPTGGIINKATLSRDTIHETGSSQGANSLAPGTGSLRDAAKWGIGVETVNGRAKGNEDKLHERESSTWYRWYR